MIAYMRVVASIRLSTQLCHRPMSGTVDEAGGVESARIRSRRKKATKMLMPGTQNPPSPHCLH